MKRFNEVLGILAGVLITIMAFLATFEAIARSLFNHPTLWSLPISQYLLLGSAFLTGAYCLQTNGHVNVELLIDRFKPKTKTVLIVIGYLMSMVYVALLLWFTTQAAILAGRFGWDVLTTFPIPSVILYGMIIFGLAVLLLTFACKLFSLATVKR